MKVKIAVFGKEITINRLKTMVTNQTDVEMVPFPYDNEAETVELIEKAFMCDVFLFTEEITYLFAKQKIEKKRLPTIVIPSDELMVLTNLYQLKNSRDTIRRISIDYGDKTAINHVLEDLHMNRQNIHIYDYSSDSDISIDHIVDYHSNLWGEGKIDYVLTSVKSVGDRLLEMGIPTRPMVIPSVSLKQALEKAKSKVKLDLSKSAQVVTGYVRIKNHEEIAKKKGEKELQQIITKLQVILTKFSKKTDISVYPLNNHQLILFGTKALINHLTNHYRDFPLLREIKTALDVPVDMGYGLGLTAKQSDVNAQIAIETCGKTEDSKCYIVNERKETIGPIGIKKEFDASKLYQALIHKARLNNELSYNFIDFIRLRNNEPFSSNDIANYYNVTKRSAERTVNKLLNGEVIRVAGEERPYQKGRPRKLFTLNQ
ncbi:hypothetical protein [Oceanobacillus senegalensis]|uniref:hypothetical protein n=1 Tax=Oceanobacillus senegalensis TaxID=1936063 RepID=UPI000A30FA2E|nr:hypothetical protein [Oceanobacillus senegalensis]